MKKKESTEITVQSPSEVATFITQAIAANLPVDVMEKLFAMQERYKAERAREAFVTAMADFQSNCPTVAKTKKVMNKDGSSVRYQYAPLDAIVDAIKKPLSAAGLAYTWDVKNETGFMTAVCTITHALGHSQTSEFKVPIDTEGYMTAPQKYASALTFAKRYSLCNALGISTGDEDTDATDVGKEPTAKSDKSKIVFLLRTLGKTAINKENVEKEVKALTQLDVTDKNLGEIVARLEVLVQEKNADKEIQ